MNLGKAISAGVVLLAVFVAGLFAGGEGDVEVSDLPLAPVADNCPPGWRDTSTRDEHVIVYSCSRDGWLVILNPGGDFGYAIQDGRSEFVADPGEVPNWPAP